MTLKEQADTYSAIITTNLSRNASGYERLVTAELIRRLGECIPGQNLRSSATSTTEVDPSFSEALELYAAEYKGSASSEKLNHIHILGGVQDSPAWDLERLILQCGKRLRLLNAPVAQCHVNFVQLFPNSFVMQQFEEMLDCLKKDKAVAGRVVNLALPYWMIPLHICGQQHPDQLNNCRCRDSHYLIYSIYRMIQTKISFFLGSQTQH